MSPSPFLNPLNPKFEIQMLFYWAAKELGMSMTELAGHLGLTQPAVSIQVRKL